jgi:ribosomal protein S18 acetylase RimI-like enzyme
MTRRKNPTVRLAGFGKPRAISPAVEAFIRDLFDASHPLPFKNASRTERVLTGIEAVVEVTPQYAGIHVDEVRALTQKQGEGTKAIRFLTDLADKHGVELYLYAKPFGNEAMDLDNLVRFYRRHGFREMEEEDEDGEGVEMMRWPHETLRSNPARKAKPPTLAAAGLPEVWFHGTQKAFPRLKAQGGACIWLADKAGAMAYATPSYGRRSAIRLIEVTLSPDTRVVDLADASDPAVRSFIHLDASVSNMRWHGREDVTDAEMADAVARWNARRTHYDAIEARSWAKAHFRKTGADALLVRDVAGWGGHEAMPSLCLLNAKKVLGERDVAPDLALVRAEDMPKHPNPRFRAAGRKVSR